MTVRDDLLRDYRTAFLRYLSRRDEEALAEGYALGRRALVEGRSLLDVVHAHHVVLAETSGTSALGPPEVQAASEFLVESLASFEMARRAPPARPTE